MYSTASSVSVTTMHTLAALALAASAHALAVRGGCSLQMTAGGDNSGPVGELSSGQIRFGNIDSTTFTFNGGALYDSKGKGCWWTREFSLPALKTAG